MKRTPLRPSLTPMKCGEFRRGRPLGPGTTPLPQHGGRIKTRRVSRRFAARRDPAYKAWIVTLRCVVTGRPGVDPAHVRSRGAAGDDRGNIVPLTHRLHEALHQHGVRTFERKYGIDLKAKALALLAEYERGEFR